MKPSYVKCYSVLFLLLLIPLSASATDKGLKQYTDPDGRFIFDYPATMKLESHGKDEIRISHPNASLRIAIFIEKRETKKTLSSDELLETFKKNIKGNMKNVAFLEQGKAPNISGVQFYFVCSFTNSKGAQIVQLVQYYVTLDKILQMTISDRPEGFKNLLQIIRKIHHSLRILKPSLK